MLSFVIPLSVLPGRVAGVFFEYPFKVGQVFISHRHGDGRDIHVLLHKETAGFLYPLCMQILKDSESRTFFENTAYITFIHIEMFCHRGQSQWFAVVLCDISGDFFRLPVP